MGISMSVCGKHFVGVRISKVLTSSVCEILQKIVRIFRQSNKNITRCAKFRHLAQRALKNKQKYTIIKHRKVSEFGHGYSI